MELKNNRKKRPTDLSTMIYGKVPPQAKDLEESILGICMLEPRVVDKVKEILKKEDFYVEANQKIYQSILEVSKTAIVDSMLVVENLRQKEELDSVGGVYYLVKLTNSVVSSSNIERWCRIVKEKSIFRTLIRFSGEIIGNAYEDSIDVFDLLNDAEQILKNINFELDEMKITQVSNVAFNIIDRFTNKIYCAKNNIINPKEVYTRIPEWDRVNGSLFGGVYIILARPGMGKGVHMTECICRMGKEYKVGVINGEMTNEQLLTRIGCNLKSIDNRLWKKNPITITDEEQKLVYEAMQEAINLKLYIEDNKYIDRICNRIKLWVERDGVQVIFADFLTLFKVPDEIGKYFTPIQRVDYVLEMFASISKKLEIPIILYAQMNRENLKRNGSPEPTLGDAKQSGSIEEYAFQVSGLHRPEYYDAAAITDEFGESTKGLMYQIILKHRDGEMGRIKYRSVLQCSQLKEWDDGIFQRWQPKDFTQSKKEQNEIEEQNPPF